MANTQRCPFYGCSKMIDPQLQACRHCWPKMDDATRFEIWRIVSEYRGGKMHLDEFVRQKADIMLKLTPEAAPGYSAKGNSRGEEELAKMASQYIAKRKEYTACKDGYIERKKKIGMELSRLESKLSQACDAILHPQQTQPTLFDPAKDEQLPD